MMFKYTIFILLFYQVLRYVSRTIQLREFVMPTKGGIDLFDNIIPSITDKLIFASYMIFWFALTYSSF